MSNWRFTSASRATLESKAPCKSVGGDAIALDQGLTSQAAGHQADELRPAVSSGQAQVVQQLAAFDPGAFGIAQAAQHCANVSVTLFIACPGPKLNGRAAL